MTIPQRVAKFNSGSESVLWRFLETTFDDAEQRRREIPSAHTDVVGGPVKDTPDHREWCVRGKGMDPGGIFRDEHAEREHIGSCIRAFTIQLLGRHIRRRADDRPWKRHGNHRLPRGRVEARQTEVENLDRALPGPHDVLRLEIAVDDAAAMGVSEGVRELDGSPEPACPAGAAFHSRSRPKGCARLRIRRR